MLHIKIEGNMNIDAALKKYKYKFIKTGVTKELTERKEFTKNSVKRRDQIKKARYVQAKKNRDNE